MSKGGGTQTTTAKSEPWKEQQPYLKRGFQEAEKWLDSGGAQYYPNQTLAPIAPATMNALDLMQQRAYGGSPLHNAMLGQTMKTIQGDYTRPESNPYLRDTFNMGARDIERRVRSAFGHDDSRTGSSGLQQAALSTGLADLATQLYGGNYGRERAIQANMTPFGRDAAQSEYDDLQRLTNIGDAQRQLTQDYLNADQQRFNYNQNLPLQTLSQFMQNVRGDFGRTTTQSTPYSGGSPIGGLLGLGMMAMGGPAGLAGGLGSMFGGGGGLVGSYPLWGNQGNLYGLGGIT